jgi:hypothetical protein
MSVRSVFESPVMMRGMRLAGALLSRWRRHAPPSKPFVALVGLAFSLTLAGCGEGSDGDHAREAQEGPAYAVVSNVFGEAEVATYVSLLDSLDEQTVRLDSALELAGWASIAPFEGDLLISDGESPSVRRYEIVGGSLKPVGRTLSFANFGASSASFFHNVIIDANHAHLKLEETSRVVWNPSDLALSDDEPVVAAEIVGQRDGLSVSASNFEGVAIRDDGVFWPYFWHDADWYEFHQQSQIGIYRADGSVSLLDVPCPALNIATQDEAGNTYFSGMVDTIAFQRLEASSTLERCVARINAGEQTVADGWPRSLEELTGGRPAGRFYYLRDGVALLSVFHAERATVDPEDIFTSFFGDHWALWLVDLENWTARRIEGRDYGSSNLFFSRIGQRTFIHDVAADFTETVISEIDIDGTITPLITVPGYAIVLRQVR